MLRSHPAARVIVAKVAHVSAAVLAGTFFELHAPAGDRVDAPIQSLARTRHAASTIQRALIHPRQDEVVLLCFLCFWLPLR
jgi:hypothetical protein